MKSKFARWSLTTTLIALAAFTSACKKNEGTPAPEPQAQQADRKPMELALPGDTDEGVIDFSKVTEGTYAVAEIHTLVTDGKTGSQAGFIHTMAKLGEPANGDPTHREATWIGFNPEEKKLRLIAEFNLPLALTSAGGKVEFNQKRYYWHYQESDKSWAWRISGGSSPDGVQYYAVFTDGKLEGAATYALAVGTTLSVKGIVKQTGDEVATHFEATFSSGSKLLLKVVYRKQ